MKELWNIIHDKNEGGVPISLIHTFHIVYLDWYII